VEKFGTNVGPIELPMPIRERGEDRKRTRECESHESARPLEHIREFLSQGGIYLETVDVDENTQTQRTPNIGLAARIMKF
jgi:hypothetical protein